MKQKTGPAKKRIDPGLNLRFGLFLFLLLCLGFSSSSSSSSSRKSSTLTEAKLGAEDRVVVGEEHRSSEDWVRVSLVWLFFGASITGKIQSQQRDLLL